MKLISLLFAPLSLCLIILAGILFKKDKISFQTLLAWSMIWGIIGTAFLFPNAINKISKIFGMTNRMFFVFTVSIIFLFLITFLNFIKIRQNELTNIKIIQQISLLSSTLDDLKKELKYEDNSYDSSL